MYFILGQGLAGTCLAYRFLSEKIPFVIFDNNHKSCSAMVAAGLWNPIVFKRTTTSWLADDVISELESFYPKIEKITQTKFFYPGYNIRLYSSEHEKNEWNKKQNTPKFKKYLETTPHEEITGLDVSEFGFGRVNHTGHVNLPKFLKASREYFLNINVLETVTLHLPETVDELKSYTHNGIKPVKIIDCRGVASAYSSWWEYLPFKLSKGETIRIKCQGLKIPTTVNSSVFIHSLGDNLFKVGSTYSWSELNENPTVEARNELIFKLGKILPLPFEVISQSAGVRPTVSDRRPLIGTHPEANNLMIFNGLGTKGVMLAPYFSKQLCASLTSSETLNPEVDIARFK